MKIAKIFLFIVSTGLIIFINVSCNGVNDLSSKVPALEGTSADTIVVREKSVLFYHPDTLQIQKIKAKIPENSFESIEHECAFMTNNARLSMRKNWKEIKELDNHRARYLLCLKTDKSRICIDMNAPADLCAMYAFDPKKDPLPIDMMNVETEVYNYFFRK